MMGDGKNIQTMQVYICGVLDLHDPVIGEAKVIKIGLRGQK